MHVVASDSAVKSIADGGGRLYVWPRRGRCCGTMTTLATSSAPPAGKEFRLVHRAGFELYMPSSLPRFPAELHLELRRFPHRVDAYWDGCAWVL